MREKKKGLVNFISGRLLIEDLILQFQLSGANKNVAHFYLREDVKVKMQKWCVSSINKMVRFEATRNGAVQRNQKKKKSCVMKMNTNSRRAFDN